jgi:U3 small nucleolar RNA-associated protein 6
MDAVAPLLEETLAHVRAWRDRELISEPEARSICQRRERFELSLRRRPAPTRDDFTRYAQFESDLGRLIRRRAARLGGKHARSLRGKLAFACEKRVHGIFGRALRRFSHDAGLWREYAAFCEHSGATTMLARVLGRALQRHPRQADLWMKAAQLEFAWESPTRRNVHSARALYQRGLRLCAVQGLTRSQQQQQQQQQEPDSGGDSDARRAVEDLWVAYCRMELDYLKLMLARRKVLRGEVDSGESKKAGGLEFIEGESSDNEAADVDGSGGEAGSADEVDMDDIMADSDAEAEDGDGGVTVPELAEEATTASIAEPAQDESQGSDFWSCGVPRVVCFEAIRLMPDSLNFRLRLVELLGKYSFAKIVAHDVGETLRTDFFPESVLAVRTLAEAPRRDGGQQTVDESLAVFDEAVKELLGGTNTQALQKVLESYVAYCAGLLSKHRSLGSEFCDRIQRAGVEATRLGASVSPKLLRRWVSELTEQAGGQVPPQVLSQLRKWLLPKRGATDEHQHVALIRTQPDIWELYADLLAAVHADEASPKSREAALSCYASGIRACVRAYEQKRTGIPNFAANLRSLFLSFAKFWLSVAPSENRLKEFIALQQRELADLAMGESGGVVTAVVARDAFLRAVLDARAINERDFAASDVRRIVAEALSLPIPQTVSYHRQVIVFEAECAAADTTRTLPVDLSRALDRAVKSCGSGQGSEVESLWLSCVRISVEIGDWAAASDFLWRAKRELTKVSDEFMQAAVGMGVSV